MIILFILSVTLFILGVIFFIMLLKRQRSFGVLNKKRIYQDTEQKPGEVLYAKTIPLSGKPDYLIQDKGLIIPVEVKTGTTPLTPYPNHTEQLMAYCLLVQENFGIRPMGGVLRYPKKEFKLLYTNEAEKSVRNIVMEILKKKESGEEIFCKHPEHNLFNQPEEDN